jgi:glycosyltransferase involved in cell wall biosynthesis
MKQVSILIPVYNREQYIVPCLDSVFRQTYKDFEVVVYDDGSTDNTIKILEQKYAGRIRLIRGEHLGVAGARNKLLEAIETPYACWQDSDDVMHDQRVELQLRAIKDENKDMMFSYMYFFAGPIHTRTRQLRKINPSRYSMTYRSLYNNTNFASAFFKSELKETKFVKEIKTGGEDCIWLYNLISQGKTFGVVPKGLYFVRRHQGRITTSRRNTPELILKEQDIVLKEIKRIQDEKLLATR